MYKYEEFHGRYDIWFVDKDGREYLVLEKFNSAGDAAYVTEALNVKVLEWNR